MMGYLRSFLTYTLYPLVFGGGMVFAVWGIDNALSDQVIIASVALATALIVTVGERINPYYDNWNKSQQDIKTDAIHTGVSMVMLPQLLGALYITLIATGAIKLSTLFERSLWPHDWHIMYQLLLAMLIGGFFEYWSHRLMHEWPALWRFHATHHSPGRLYWLNAGRFHPVDTFIGYTLSTVPLLLLGAGPQVFVLVTIWIAIHGMFQHCNIRLRLGPLNYIFSMAELHRWHHSLKLEEANTNYGNNIIFWDMVFGTMYWPREREPSEHIGLHDIKHFPKNYLGQILSPWRWKEME